MIFKDLFNLFVPRICLTCQATLLPGETCLCLECQTKLPRVRAEKADNEVEHRVFGHFPFMHGTSFCYYRKGGEFAKLVKQAKYNGKPWINAQLSKLYAAELTAAGWPFDIDVIIPVPSHWLRRCFRGYTQTHSIGDALGKFWHLPVEKHNLYKSKFTISQVSQKKEDRLLSMKGTFSLHHPEQLKGQHVLIVDDVLTTGSTIEACSQVLTEAGAKISFLTLGLSD